MIGGLQKLTLLDYPGKVACTVFLTGCNFRCPFCHNAPLVLSPDPADCLGSDEVLEYLESRRGRLDGVCVTGGEPLLDPETPGLLRDIKKLGFSVKLDTNGSFPDVLEAVISEGLVDHVAMDIKTDPAHYSDAAGCRADVGAVCRSADLLRGGAVSFEFRTTVMRGLHTAESIEEIGKRFGGDYRYFLQNYVKPEFPVGDSSAFDAFDENEMKFLLTIASKYFTKAEIRGK